MKHKHILPLILSGLIAPVVAQADWTINTFSSGASPAITNLATADALIGGFGQLSQFSQTYTTSNTQDNGDGGGPFGLGVQIAGLPAGGNDNFAFKATALFTVTSAASYTFFNDTDDGSRLRLSINGGAFSTIINDDVLSGPHTVLSAAIPLAIGNSISLEWTWFEAGGGAEGETGYSVDGGVTKSLWENGALGLSLTGSAYTGTVYRANLAGLPGTNPGGPNNLAEADAYVSNGLFINSNTAPVINFGAGGRAAGETPLPAGTPGDHFVVTGTGFIRVEPGQEGDWTFFTNTDDGARLRINGTDVVLDGFLQGPSDSAYSVYNFPAAGDYAVDYIGFENGGGEDFEVLVKQGNFAAAKGFGDPAGAVLLGAAGGLAVNVVPEPGTASLAFLGLAGLVGLRRRRA